MKETTKRLYQAALELKNVKGKTAVGALVRQTPQTLYNWETRGISKAGILDAAKYIGCSAVWLEYGIGPMVTGSSNDQEIEIEEEITMPPPSSPIPLYKRPKWDDMENKGKPIRFINTLSSHSDKAYAVEVRDDTLVDLEDKIIIRKGDIVALDPDMIPKNKDIVFATSSDYKMASLKVYCLQDGKGFLYTPNPQWQMPFIEIDDTIKIHAVAFEVIKILGSSTS